MGFIFLKNEFIRGIFTHALPHSQLTPSCCHRKSVSPPVQMGEGNYKFLYQNSVRKCEHDLEHYLFHILYDLHFFKCDGFTIL